MSQGPTLFSRGMTENDRWRDVQLRVEQPGGWERLADEGAEAPLWHGEAAGTRSVTRLIQELSLSDRQGPPSAPPSKRQCRSLSFSDEMSSCRTAWRPLGSKVWTPVEKRRCYSGGSVPRYSNGAAPMQRSSSFSLPSRCNALPLERAALGGSAGCRDVAAPCGAAGGRAPVQRSLSCSHEPRAAPAASRTPELPRRPPALPRSRSQPCVLSDKKVGVKRRRHEEQRPSLDLAKMTQNRQTFNSLSCVCVAPDSGAQPEASRARSRPALASPDTTPGRTPACTPVPEPERVPERRQRPDGGATEELWGDEGDEGGARAARAPWRRGGASQLGGEIDIEQIENN